MLPPGEPLGTVGVTDFDGCHMVSKTGGTPSSLVGLQWEILFKMDDLGIPLFQETSIWLEIPYKLHIG